MRSSSESGLADIALHDMRTPTLAVSGACPELKIRHRIRKVAVWLGTNAFFFE